VTQGAGRPKGQTGRCPICGKEATPDYRPFCSKRCADVDLQRWLSGRYAIPVVEEDQGVDRDPDEPTRER
jgi:endogenous inhibitor of DNA gyrase (YacG/DUF329 family)